MRQNDTAGLGAASVRARRLAVVACLLCGVVPIAAQDAADVDPLAAVRGQASFGAAQDQVIDQWIAARIDELKAASADDSVKAGQAFTTSFRHELINPAGTARYLDRLAERTAAAVAAEFNAGNDGDEKVHGALARVLYAIGRFPVRDGLEVGLRHKSEQVRYYCAKGFAKLKSGIGADVALTRNTIGSLKGAGASEVSDVVLGAIYDALGYDQVRHLGEVVPALAEVLAAQAKRRSEGGQVLAGRAELRAYYYLKRVRNNIAQQSKAPLVGQLAAMLALDVRRYEFAPPDEILDLQERIDACEELIQGLAGAAANGGNIRAAMKAGGVAVAEEMGLELIKWVGAPGQQGSLNSAPWNVPVGGLP